MTYIMCYAFSFFSRLKVLVENGLLVLNPLLFPRDVPLVAVGQETTKRSPRTFVQHPSVRALASAVLDQVVQRPLGRV